VISAEAEELVARARKLHPLLAAQAPIGGNSRRLTDETVNALTDAGLFRLMTPRRYGGHESGLRTLIDVGATVGAADGSTAWVLTLCNACAWVVGLFPEQAERVPGGYRVSGK
jgi:alkylation response protein AidB-like acyl-CoA dehydrogenase